MAYDMYIAQLQEKEQAGPDDLLVIEDAQNTKRIKFSDFILSLIKDEDAPAINRIFSSSKVTNLLRELDRTYTEAIGLINGKVDALDEGQVSEAELLQLKDTLETLIQSTADSQNDRLSRLVESKISVGTKFTADDLDITEDAKKIKLANLAQEVIDAIVGTAPVISNKAPVGGWRTEDLADNAVKAYKLSVDFQYNGFIETDGDVDELVKHGYYLLGPDVQHLPRAEEESEDREQRVLYNRRIGKYIIQEVYYITDVSYRPIYRRIGEITKLHIVDFNRVDTITENYKVQFPMLANDYRAGKKIAGINIYEIKKDGLYITDPSVTGLPSQGKWYVDVQCFADGNIIYHAAKIDKTVYEVYESLVYLSSAYNYVITDWYKMTTNAKSKFDNKKLHIFGDGIIAGAITQNLGSNVSTSTVDKILDTKYGFISTNCALNSATAGEYNNSLVGASLNTQITRTVLDDADYAIISIGTNDYYEGIASMGSNDSANTSSFKGALNVAIKNILEANPNVKIMLTTPIFRGRFSAEGDGKNSDKHTSNSKLLKDFADAIIEIGKQNHVPVLDMLSIFPANKYNFEEYLSDGVHLNIKGQELFADQLFNGLSQFY